MTNKHKFIAQIYPAAVKISQEIGMSEELILAQAAQETGWGQHVLAGTHNIFNIKTSADWKGSSRTFKVWEIENGQKVWKDQDFRTYGSTGEAVQTPIETSSAAAHPSDFPAPQTLASNTQNPASSVQYEPPVR